jgi:hypothetical protein
MKRTLVVVFCVIVLCSLLAVPLLLQHSAPVPTPTPTPTPTPAPSALERAVANAINFFEESRQPTDSYVLLMLNVINRRFGIAAFSDALQQYDQMMDENPGQAPLLRVFRRIADHDNPLQAGDFQAVTDEGDRLTVAALYCDRLGLPDDYPAMLEQAAGLGNYMLAHVLLACIWIQENGCEVPLPDGFIEEIYYATAVLIGARYPVVDDLELEAAAFLYLAGQGALVDHAFVERVIAVQNYDGGWLSFSDEPGESDWHTTVLALLLLLHVEFPANSYPPMLAPASP